MGCGSTLYILALIICMIFTASPANSGEVIGRAEPGDHFGWAFASGWFDYGNIFDLAIGVPFENIGGKANAGAINILYGSKISLQTAPIQFLQKGDLSITGPCRLGSIELRKRVIVAIKKYNS